MTEIFNNPEEEPTDPKEKIKPKYISRIGFEEVPIRRGFTEIQHLWFMLEPYIVRDDCIICGGYVRWMASPHMNPAPAGDIDLYFRDQDFFDLAKGMFENEKLEIKFENEICISFKKIDDRKNQFFGTPQVQLIKPVIDGAIVATGTMKEILENFDFTIVRAGLVAPDLAMVDADFLHDEEKKIPRIKNIHCPISSTLRCMKYSRKGYWLPPMQCCRLFLDWQDRTEEYREKILHFLTEADKGEGLTREQIDEMERLMRID